MAAASRSASQRETARYGSIVRKARIAIERNTRSKRSPLLLPRRGLRSPAHRGLFHQMRPIVKARLSSRIDQQRRRLEADEIFELSTEVFERHVDGCGKLREFMRILEVVAAEPDHVTAGDGVT